MAELVLRLIVDPATGKRTVVADYQSDADALPMEHEEDHRRLVDALVDGDRKAHVAVDRVAEAAPTGSEEQASPQAGRTAVENEG